MTEADWLAYTDARPLLIFLRGKVSDRKLRLFTCACCRRWDHLLKGERTRRALTVSERFADRLADSDELDAAWDFAWEVSWAPAADQALSAARSSALATGWSDAWAAAWATAGNARAVGGDPEPAALADLLREVVANPFQALALPENWPANILKLAGANYAGEDCHIALRGTLLEARHFELAEHFREPRHPKGCWLVDLILGKR
jgi:hypothetical protein